MKEGKDLKSIKKKVKEKPESDLKKKILKDIEKKSKYATVRK